MFASLGELVDQLASGVNDDDDDDETSNENSSSDDDPSQSTIIKSTGWYLVIAKLVCHVVNQNLFYSLFVVKCRFLINDDTKIKNFIV